MHIATTVAAIGVAAMLSAGAARGAPMLAATDAPAATVQPAIDVGPTPKVELVRGGCGWGAHRTWRGTCHLNYGWRGRVRAHWGWHRWHWHRW